MSKAVDFSRGRRGAVLASRGKTRITIYLDDAIIERFKALSEQTGKGYQTLINDALADPRLVQIPDTDVENEAIVIVPLVSGDEVVGAMNISRVGGPEVGFTDADFELVQLFGGQAAVAITNARLYEQLRERVDAQRTLAEIAAQIAALHDPQTVLDRAVKDAARLLHEDRAQINLIAEEGDHLDRPIAAAPTPPSPEDVEARLAWTLAKHDVTFFGGYRYSELPGEGDAGGFDYDADLIIDGFQLGVSVTF